ncbi:MAG: hypothetical protein A2087_05125 [Spirochaetes bacterium GWD1_61_31]|nr:MAG: hypothetical protein A2Y37_00870 [Spirochaetes bacterium GWB1_60_80]OHD35377.1 MAG: hypothetical protein A2004_09110 [Spirochaetes bacterium GWC1_61_12]OHD36526.1 MAG: hypothetical protein A2087_05125 [Spirochaetes bacterium GWD1_61_31]OHD42240.1 MAG: hypothetical protein A2Y35_09320 [Spirochaetes bacterium GWE1_60_18]OHD58169.1 MAG: hypothetical protein A2Y32_14890 [Spirochaetes bacterium GWF1_60_12]HBO40905.1 hydrogenase [Spirochaetaceae bacterium]
MSMAIGDKCIGCTACVKACPVGAISGEKKSRHDIDPARCIECGACGRLCPTGAVSDSQGVPVVRLLPRAAWAKPVFDLRHCISCAACADHCPVTCLALSTGQPGGLACWPSQSAPEKCVSCGLCAFYCPMDCIAIRQSAGERNHP